MTRTPIETQPEKTMPKPIFAHELAKQLLAGPNNRVIVYVSECETNARNAFARDPRPVDIKGEAFIRLQLGDDAPKA